ncbi:hypothetical protein [Porphyromonas levii]|uniref:hypothetical protein n=1 Tax=Porphyromonas levii TaxID=28114 RepID=UPI001B8D485C|nr:hypothetical protein [Porphyromonas levii]MBR8712799.1 hypothetical protein [Porphyromonas levii]MBR8714848.1 hypothetical protein [Porphyromonas levii]MBR8727292.1 hypothetical protein [Porphyromonas levii]MBR8732279.1 hypothetical protein [Porphyromonas levii]MBR8735667.1 hypothetical protein [Porphyromonas levii]
MKNIRHIHKALLLTSTMLMSGALAHANPYAPDTLQREMLLQRDYQPVGQQAEKAFFNPLQSTGATSLRPISFARNTYPIAMNVTPKLFSPLDNPLEPDHVKQLLHARIFGGFPGHVGANIGVLTKTSDVGTLLISADHLSRFVQVPQKVYPLSPWDQTHDTEVALDYSHALPDRVYNIGVDVFHHANTYYGIVPDLIKGTSQLTAEYPLARMIGTDVRIGVSPSPLSLARGVQYSIDGKVGYISKDDISSYYTENNIIIPKNTAPINGHKVAELSLDLKGNLGYQFAGSDWSLGADGRYQLISISALNNILGNRLNPLQALSVAPYFAYIAPSFIFKAGASIQLLNIGSKKFLIIPDVQARFKANDHFSIYLNSDGGAEYHTLRDIYRQNRWADAMSVYQGYDIANYRVLAGVQVGNINGFSLDVHGGYASYLDFSEWMANCYVTYYSNELVMDGPDTRSIYTPLYSLKNAGAVGNIFVGAKARYISSIGLDLGASVKYNHYKSRGVKQVLTPNGPEEAKDYTVGYGRPTYEIGISGDYAINDKIGINVNFTALGGIRMPELSQPTDALGIVPPTLLPEETIFVADFGARISYKVHRNIGLSLIGENLFNQRIGRWRGYDRQGATAVLAATFAF